MMRERERENQIVQQLILATISQAQANLICNSQSYSAVNSASQRYIVQDIKFLISLIPEFDYIDGKNVKF